MPRARTDGRRCCRPGMAPGFWAVGLAAWAASAAGAVAAGDHWEVREGGWSIEADQIVARGGFSLLTRRAAVESDLRVEAEVATYHDQPFALAGLALRMADDGSGYLVGVRQVARGVDPTHGAWERPVLQLYRVDADGSWRLLQEAKVMGSRDGKFGRIRAVCRGPRFWVYYEEMDTPVFREYDDRLLRPGLAGLFKDQAGEAVFRSVVIDTLSDAEPDPAPAPSETDWSWVRGAVYVRSNAVNSVEMWHDYWDHTVVIDRELAYARRYGFNLVQVYLHWIVYDRHGSEYLRRIVDFLDRADRHGLQATFIFWDDCGNVEPSLEFAAPVPGRHNSQMMPNPSHAIRDDAAALDTHRARFGEYVTAIAERFRDDPRIAFWQLYNEPLGHTESYRVGSSDANINRLLAWTLAWVKGTGTQTPVTATGGGFYGPKYSDFYSYHSYRMEPEGPLPHADGGPEHLCTETLSRPTLGLVDIVEELSRKRNGFVVWELMVGRDNCRLPWGSPDGIHEPGAPFHGVVYPDGHPWDLDEVRALLGDQAYESLEERSFRVDYYNGRFAELRKTSIVPAIDFDLGDEPGTGSPDASAGIGTDGFSMRYGGRLIAPGTGPFTFTAVADGTLELAIGGAPVVRADGPGGPPPSATVELVEGREYTIVAEYFHRAGDAYARVGWEGPGTPAQVLSLD